MQALHCSSNGVDVVRVDQEASIPGNFRQASCVGSDQWRSRGEGFEDREPEPFPKRGVHRELRAGIDYGELRVRQVPQFYDEGTKPTLGGRPVKFPCAPGLVSSED